MHQRQSIAALLAVGLMTGLLGPGLARAGTVLDTGTPSSLATPLVLDGNDFYAAEFSLATTATIDGISAYLTAGLDNPGASFTVAIYADPIASRFATPDYSVQASYAADGWNLTRTAGLGWVEGPGRYWVALEVGTSDSALGLGLPTGASTGGTVPALGFAFDSGAGYTSAGALPFGVQLSASPVPQPPSAWLLGAGLGVIGAVLRRRRAAA